MDGYSLLVNSLLYREHQAELEEIGRHKWYESEKAGYDIGFEHALVDWIVKHRSKWLKHRRQSFNIAPVHVRPILPDISLRCK